MKILISAIIILLLGCYSDSAETEPPPECTEYKFKCENNVIVYCDLPNHEWKKSDNCNDTLQECSTECYSPTGRLYKDAGCCIDIE